MAKIVDEKGKHLGDLSNPNPNPGDIFTLDIGGVEFQFQIKERHPSNNGSWVAIPVKAGSH